MRPYLYGAALVLLALAAAEGVRRLTGTDKLASVFLTAVLIVAFLFGAPPAYVTATLALVAYNVFVNGAHVGLGWPPGEFADVIAFFSVAMLTGNLTGRVRDEASRALARERATAALFDATREFSASDDESFIRRQLAHHLSSAAHAPALVADPHSVELAKFAAPSRVAPAKVPDFPDIRPEGAVQSLRVGETTFRPLYAGEALVAVAAWKTSPDQQRPKEQALLEILSEVGAAAVARARLAAAKADSESRTRTEELRNALLSSISHDLRTPLAAILASSSSLDEFGEVFDAATRRDLAKTIQEEAERLNDFVSNLLHMTKLESGVLTPAVEPFAMGEVVERTVRRRAAAAKREVKVHCAPEVEALGDPVLFEQALGNVVENAIKYSPREAAVEVACERIGDEVVVRVADAGPGVSPAELVMLFVKFYRTSQAEKVRGTGLGLSITKGLVEGMGGSVTASNRAPPETGLVVTMTLPAAPDA